MTSRVTQDGRVDRRTSSSSYQAIADKVGASRTHVSRVLRGKSGVSPVLAGKIAEVIGVTVNELMREVEACRDQKEWEARREYHRAYGVARRAGHPSPSEVANESLRAD